MLHWPDEPIPADKSSIFFSALASRTRSAAAFAVPRKSWSEGYVVSIDLHLLPSNSPSRKALRKGQGIVLVGTVLLPVMPRCNSHLITAPLRLLLGFAVYPVSRQAALRAGSRSF